MNNKKWCKIWKGTNLLVENWHKEFNKFWPEHPKISKICTLMGCFWPKYTMFQLRKYRGVMFDGTQDWYKIWRKTDLCFRKMTWGILQIFTRARSKVWKFGLLLGPFIQNKKCMSLKFTEELCIMKMKTMQKLKWTFLPNSKLTWRIWWFLTWALENLKNVYFNGLLLTKVYNIWAEKGKEVQR